MKQQNNDANPVLTENQNKKSRIKKILLWIGLSFISVILIVAIIVSVLVLVGKKSLLGFSGIDVSQTVSDSVVEDDGKTVFYNDKKYIYNENITAVLCMGVDDYGLNNKKESVQGKNNHADALFLYVMDTKSGKSTIIPIPRDTIADVELYSPEGKYVQSSKKQICLAYAYGDGEHKSCENTVKSVSRLLYGIPINSYIAIKIKAIEPLSNAVNGVAVTPSADISVGYNKYKAGKTVVLNGKQSLAFVQQRSNDLNASLDRMGRQKMFVEGFFNKALSMTKQDIKTPIKLYNIATKNMVTNINIAKVSYFTACVLNGSAKGGMAFKSIEGKMVEGENSLAEYHIDENSAYQTVLDVFYNVAE